jgi:hypothetical protein
MRMATPQNAGAWNIPDDIDTRSAVIARRISGDPGTTNRRLLD